MSESPNAVSPYQAALDAVDDARHGLEDAVVAAKDAYRNDPSEQNKAAKEAAVKELQAARAVERAGGRPLVAGDVVAANVDTKVHPSGVPAGLGEEYVLDNFEHATPPAPFEQGVIPKPEDTNLDSSQEA